MLSTEHLIAKLLDTGLSGETEEVFENGFCDQVFGVVKQERRGEVIRRGVLLVKLIEAFRVLGEEVLEDE